MSRNFLGEPIQGAERGLGALDTGRFGVYWLRELLTDAPAVGNGVGSGVAASVEEGGGLVDRAGIGGFGKGVGEGVEGGFWLLE